MWAFSERYCRGPAADVLSIMHKAVCSTISSCTRVRIHAERAWTVPHGRAWVMELQFNAIRSKVLTALLIISGILGLLLADNLGSTANIVSRCAFPA